MASLVAPGCLRRLLEPSGLFFWLRLLVLCCVHLPGVPPLGVHHFTIASSRLPADLAVPLEIIVA